MRLAPTADDNDEPSTVAPQGCKVMLALDKKKLAAGKPDADSSYWN